MMTMVRGAAILCCAVVCMPAMRVVAQDIRGLEICTAEKQMDRRTSCLQSNVEFLQQSLNKTAREAQDKLAVAGRQIVAANAEIAALKAALAKLQAEVSVLSKAAPGKTVDGKLPEGKTSDSKPDTGSDRK